MLVHLQLCLSQVVLSHYVSGLLQCRHNREGLDPYGVYKEVHGEIDLEYKKVES
jgi:hypothetical protein